MELSRRDIIDDRILDGGSFLKVPIESYLELLGIELDVEKNQQRSKVARDISAPGSAVRVLVVPTNEELEIALQSQRLI